jgi:hypothetical protein
MMTMPDSDYMFARTPTGSKAHLVDVARESMGAINQDGSDHASMCGRVPSEWRTQLDPPDDALETCQVCARKALSLDQSQDVISDLPASREYVETAGRIEIHPRYGGQTDA